MGYPSSGLVRGHGSLAWPTRAAQWNALGCATPGGWRARGENRSLSESGWLEGAKDLCGRVGSPCPVECVLVDEIGVLLELYAAADWAMWAGALASACTARSSRLFSESLWRAGPTASGSFRKSANFRRQLSFRLSGTGKNFQDGLRGLRAESSRRGEWKAEAAGRLGATARVLAAIRDSIRGSIRDAGAKGSKS